MQDSDRPDWPARGGVTRRSSEAQRSSVSRPLRRLAGEPVSASADGPGGRTDPLRHRRLCTTVWKSFRRAPHRAPRERLEGAEALSEPAEHLGTGGPPPRPTALPSVHHVEHRRACSSGTRASARSTLARHTRAAAPDARRSHARRLDVTPAARASGTRRLTAGASTVLRCSTSPTLARSTAPRCRARPARRASNRCHDGAADPSRSARRREREGVRESEVLVEHLPTVPSTCRAHLRVGARDA